MTGMSPTSMRPIRMGYAALQSRPALVGASSAPASIYRRRAGGIGMPPADLPAEPVTIASARAHAARLVHRRPARAARSCCCTACAQTGCDARPRAAAHGEGFSVLLFDFQAHGESTARASPSAASKASTPQRGRLAAQRLPGERVGAIGSSLGGAARCWPVPLPSTRWCSRAVYPDIGSAIANRVRVVLGPSSATSSRADAWLFEVILPPFIGMRPAELRPIDGIARVTAPLLIASGTRDHRTTMAETQAMFERAPEPKPLWAVEGAGHVDLEGYAPEEYRRRVVAFLVSTCGRASFP